MAKDERINSRCSKEFKEKLVKTCSRTGMSQADLLEHVLDVYDDMYESREFLKDDQGLLVFTKLIMKRIK